MANVNDATHQGFNESSPNSKTNPDASGDGAVLFWPYDGGKPRVNLAKALWIIKHNVVGKVGPATTCGRYFSALPNGKKFDDVWKDLWIHWHPYANSGFLGATSATKANEITLSNDSLNQNVWVVVATIMHEMAHVNGAPGGTSQAEDTLKVCGMWKHWNAGSAG